MENKQVDSFLLEEYAKMRMPAGCFVELLLKRGVLDEYGNVKSSMRGTYNELLVLEKDFLKHEQSLLKCY